VDNSERNAQPIWRAKTVLGYAHRYDDAIRRYRHTLDLDPAYVDEHDLMGWTFYESGNTEAAH